MAILTMSMFIQTLLRKHYHGLETLKTLNKLWKSSRIQNLTLVYSTCIMMELKEWGGIVMTKNQLKVIAL